MSRPAKMLAAVSQRITWALAQFPMLGTVFRRSLAATQSNYALPLPDCARAAVAPKPLRVNPPEFPPAAQDPAHC
jgi:hypothetical protein